MSINRHNCEAFFLDYYEKNLSPVEAAELLLFLEENPDLKEIFDTYEAPFLEQEKLNFPDKEYLKKKFSGRGIDEILASEINRTNCEEFFTAFVEGLLSDNQKEKLNTFLSENQDLKNVFLLYQKCKLPAENVFFEKKESLKKEFITEQNREEYFIRAIENQLNEFEKEKLNLFLRKHPQEQKEFELFRKTTLIPEKISFEWKSQLKRRERKPVFISLYSRQAVYYAAAASILLLIGLFLFFRNNDNNTTYMVNKTNPASNKIVERKHFPVQPNPLATQPKTQSASIPLKKEKIILQPILSEDISTNPLIAQKEEPLMQITEEKQNTNSIKPGMGDTMVEEKKNAVVQLTPDAEIAEAKNHDETIASIVNPSTDKKNKYITFSAFINKKIKSILGISNTNGCETSDKIGLWDLAMVAKNGVQKIIRTEAVDIKKVCDGTGEKAEYVFTAGNFEFSKSAAR